jgi:hypothetical protein
MAIGSPVPPTVAGGALVVLGAGSVTGAAAGSTGLKMGSVCCGVAGSVFVVSPPPQATPASRHAPSAAVSAEVRKVMGVSYSREFVA